MKKRLIGFIMAVCCVFSSTPLTIHAEESWPAGPQIAGQSAIVMEVNSGAILYEKNAHEQLYPASITKILTGLLAIENSQLEETVTFSYDSVHKTEGSSIWRDVDEVMTMEQCLYALMLNSANECAYAIAEHVGGTYEEFIGMMNDRAQKLGCVDTHFNNPHGLPDEAHYTTCYDMALIASEAIQNDTFARITGTAYYEIPPTNKHPEDITYLWNNHKMLHDSHQYYYEYCIGGKTGYTDDAGSTLVTFAKKDGMTLVCVVMREKRPDHWTDTRALLDYCFENFQAYNIEENLGENFKVDNSDSEYLSGEVFVDISPKATIVLPKGAVFSEAAMEVDTENINKNMVGTLKFTYSNKVAGTADIEKIEQNVTEYPFESQYEIKEGETEKVVKVKPAIIFWIIFAIILLGAVGFAIFKFRDNIHLIRYYFYSRKNGDMRQDVFRRKRNKRKRRR